MDRLTPYILDLEEIEAIKMKLPSGDERAEVGRIADRVRELLCIADVLLDKGRDIEKTLQMAQYQINQVLK